MTRFILLLMLLPTLAWGTTYYVDCNADGDAGAGTTTAANVAWKTMSKVNGSTFSAGDVISLKKGCTWRETLTVPSSGMGIVGHSSGCQGDLFDRFFNGSFLF